MPPSDANRELVTSHSGLHLDETEVFGVSDCGDAGERAIQILFVVVNRADADEILYVLIMAKESALR